MSGETALACPTCGAGLLAEDRYCEHCGTRVGATPEQPQERCSSCGGPAETIGADRYCSRCGVRLRSPQDRHELDLAVAAGVSDRGRARRRNEDALQLRTVNAGAIAAVVCDGISSAASSDLAARGAADAAVAVLAEALSEGDYSLSEAMRRAVGAAQQAASGVPWSTRSDLDVPSCTLVSAICRGEELVIGWVGDSRAYWIAADDCRLLTADHSWAQEQVAAGTLTGQEAAADPRAHTITRWLGRDAPEEEPELVAIRASEPGRLVLCTDGLWNYTPEASEIAALLQALPAGTAPIAAAHSLADTALAAGGHDNVTVAILNVAPEGGNER
jgi:serine/threonine protein phosphatase PrpC